MAFAKATDHQGHCLNAFHTNNYKVNKKKIFKLKTIKALGFNSTLQGFA